MNEETDVSSAEPIDNQDKDQKLAMFQEITHLDDFEQCQAILESTNWNLDQAIQSYYTINNQSANEIETEHNQLEEISNFNPHLNSNNYDHLNNFGPTAVPLLPPTTHTSSSTSTSTTFITNKRLLNFNIEYLTNKFTLHIPDNETVYKIKELIEEKLNIPAKYIKLNGWINKSMYISDKMNLSELSLPLETNLFVINLSEQDTSGDTMNGPQTSSSITNGLDNLTPKTFELYIKIVNPKGQITIINESSTRFDFEKTEESNSNEEKFYRLHFESTTKFIDIRRTIYKLTKLIANNQEWWYFKSDCLDEIKTINSLAMFHRFIENEKIFGISLNSLVEDSANLENIKKILDDLNQSTECSTAKNSKLTPNVSNVTISTTPTSSQASVLPNTSDNIKLGFLITIKNNELIHSNNPFESLVMSKSSSKPDLMDSHTQEENEEFDYDHMTNEEDLEENFFNEETTKTKPLIPSECSTGDELVCTNSFVEEFAKRYGPITPLFFIGKLEDAIREALLCPAKDRKLLGIYLHSDHTVFHNIFGSKTLCDENVVNFLSSNFVVWPWDLTLKQNETYFSEKCSKHLGSVFTSNLRSMKEKLPIFLIVTRVRASNEVAAIIEGDSTNEMMMNRLMQTYEMFEMQRIKDESDEKTRDEREKIKREQDAAYQASLEFDKAKRQRQAEEHERIKQEKELEAEIERKKIEELNNRRQIALNSLPNEPSDDVPINQTSKIRFRLPSGEFVQRKFYISEKLKSLINFMTSEGFFTEEYKLLSSWPRRDLTQENLERTLEELKLFPQETLTLEQR